VPTTGWETTGSTCTNDLDDDCDTRTDAADPDCGDCVPEFCNTVDDDCDGLSDEDFDLDFDPMNCGRCANVCPHRPHAGAACFLGECDVVCAPGWSDDNGDPRDGCETTCARSTDPGETTCNGLDDDCDGLTDEDWTSTTTCGFSGCARPEVCHAGSVSCLPRTPPATDDTTCDGVDDDCDGATDEEATCTCTGDGDCDDANPCTLDDCGTDLLCHITPAADGAACPAGRCCSRACVDDSSELCNGRDDDCDGASDEGFGCRYGDSVSCTTSCGSAGTGLCTTACALPTGADCFAPPETCNGADEDCDGTCDNGFGCCRGAVRDCTTGTGADGVQVCGTACTWGACNTTSDPCNGADDNGDTRCDEEFECCRGATDSRACTCGGTESRSCGTACSWSSWGGCPAGECVPGANEACTLPCGSTGIRFCEASCAWGACTATAETCNGRDDDCDTSTDEGYECRQGDTSACSTGCSSSGTRTCGMACTWSTCTPPAETCNGRDDDCDTLCDDGSTCCLGATESCSTTCGTTGTRSCAAGCAWSACTPPTETCNGRDDDCDAACDDGFACCAGGSGTCTTSCGSTGSHTCSGSCAWGTCNPPAETCNGRDDDCVAGCDNGFACCAGSTRACTTGCSSTGTETCSGSCAWGSCAAPTETCNGRDDDCVAGCDNGFACCAGTPMSCTTTCGSTGTGSCSASCAVPAGGTCTPPGETCNGTDDDCDGAIDNGYRATYVGTTYTAVSGYLSSCDGFLERMGPACNAAIHRFCGTRGCTSSGFGPQENSGDALGVACLVTEPARNPGYSGLATYLSACDGVTMRNGDACNAAINRYCQASGFVGGYGPVENSGDDAWVVCLRSSMAEVIVTTYTVLSSYHGPCDGVTEWWGPNCNAAINRFCAATGRVSGWGPVEHSGDTAYVLCVSP